jgi:hypothetical protein
MHEVRNIKRSNGGEGGKKPIKIRPHLVHAQLRIVYSETNEQKTEQQQQRMQQ